MIKTFIELEAIGIVAVFKNNNILTIITKDGIVWNYHPEAKVFHMYDKL